MFSTIVHLSQDSSCSVGRGINLEEEGFSRVGLLEGGVGEDSVEEGIKGLTASWGPDKRVCSGNASVLQLRKN